MKVYTVFSWFDGLDPKVEVFAYNSEAQVCALGHAMVLWDKFVEDDWPIQPETWHQIYTEVLERAGQCGDVIEVTEHTLVPNCYFVGSEDWIQTTDPEFKIEEFLEEGFNGGEIYLFEAFDKGFEVVQVAKSKVKL